MKNYRSGIKGKKAYNNGISIVYLKDDDIIPEGFVKGGLSSRTPEQIKQIAEKSRNTQKKHWEEKSEEDKKSWANKCRDIQLNLSDDIKKSKIDKMLKTFSNKSDEDKLVISKKRSIGNKKAWDKISKEDRLLLAKTIINNGGGWNKDTIKSTLNEKYGIDNISQLSSIKLKVKESTKKSNYSKYGFYWNCQLPQCKNSIGSKGSHTKPNELFANLLNINNISYEREFSILDKLYDFKVGNILIEINPFSTHNSTWGIFNENGLDRNYHYNKTKIAKDSGYRCINIWDWDDLNKVLLLLKKRDKINARDCIIKDVSLQDSTNYLNLYHLQGYAKDLIRLGLYYKNELVSIMTFNKSRYNKKFDYELIRYCSHKYVIGGAEKLFNYFINKYDPKSIISYCDYSKFTGDVYLKLGMTFKDVKISKHWYNPKTHQHILDSLLLKLGYDKLFNTNFGKGISNKELMIKSGFVEIYDSGQASYTWFNKKRESER